jgi:hypothetical protein
MHSLKPIKYAFLAWTIFGDLINNLYKSTEHAHNMILSKIFFKNLLSMNQILSISTHKNIQLE